MRRARVDWNGDVCGDLLACACVRAAVCCLLPLKESFCGRREVSAKNCAKVRLRNRIWGRLEVRGDIHTSKYWDSTWVS